MTAPASAPTDSILRNFLRGVLPEEEVALVQQWMEENPTLAEERLAGIDASDTVVNAIAPPDTAVQQEPPAMSAASLPTQIGDFQLGDELGRGGMGVVVEAENKLTGQRVAIKLITPQFAADPHIRERFLREARAVAKIDHPNVVPILHVGEHAGLLYIVMPLLKGETLAARLEREKPIPADELMRITCDMAAGLAAAHAAGLIHRDIKPANVWLDAETGRARILDFGLVKPLDAATDGLTETGAVMGTVFYMSPEQAEGKPVDERTDLFSLGAVVYHAATGEVPFKGDSKLAVLIAVKTDTPTQPEKLNAKLPPRLAAVIRALLEKKPADRPASATEVIEQLQRKTTPKPAPSPRRSRRALWALAPSVLVLLVGILFSGTIYRVTTNQGDLAVEIEGDDVEVKIIRDGLVVQDSTTKREFTLKAGGGEIEVVEKNGIKLMTKQFEITRNGKTVVKVTAREVAQARTPPKNGDPGVAQNPDADRKAAEWVVSVGGKWEVNDDEVSFHWWVDKPLPQGSIQLKQVYLAGNQQVTDDRISVFQNCKSLTHLYLNGTRVGDEGMKHLKGCDGLRHLILVGTRVGDTGLVHLKECKSLIGLALTGKQVTDAGLAHLPDYKSLGTFGLDDTGVSDVGLVRLKDCRGLCHLAVKKTKVTEQGVIALAKALPGCIIDWDGGRIEPTAPDLHATLCVLSWGGSVKVNDGQMEITRPTDLPKAPLRLRWVSLVRHRGTSEDSLAVFKNCNELTHLDLRGTQFGDAIVDHLQGNRQLRMLDLRNTKVGTKGISELVGLLPDCTIVWDGGTFEPKKK